MSKFLQANTLRLQEHADIVRRERRTAQLLAEQLRLARRLALPDDAWRYDRMTGKAEKLERYFGCMADQVEHMSFELSRLSLEINRLFSEAGN